MPERKTVLIDSLMLLQSGNDTSVAKRAVGKLGRVGVMPPLPVQEDRVAIQLVSARAIMDLLIEGKQVHYEVLKGLPKDAKLVGVHYDSIRQWFEFGIESATFEPVDELCAAPQLPYIEVRNA